MEDLLEVKVFKYLITVNGDGGQFGAGEILVIQLDKDIKEYTHEDESGKYLEVNGDRIDYFFAFKESEVNTMFNNADTF
jgi:hypothetical protein